MRGRVAIFLDGGFVRKKLYRDGVEPGHLDVVEACNGILTSAPLARYNLLRVYYYDAKPYTETATHPLSGARIDYQKTPQAINGEKLIQGLELQPNFAVRLGTIMNHGWKLGRAAIRSMKKNNFAMPSLTPQDLVPNFQQKGVDMRIGLDIARVAFRRTADAIVLVTSDTDFVPAMKLARIEGLRVYLHTLGHPINRQLQVHADLVIDEPPRFVVKQTVAQQPQVQVALAAAGGAEDSDED